MTILSSLHSLSDGLLLDETIRLAARERGATPELIAAIAEVDARRLYLGESCPSMFVYCTRVLKLSEHAAYDRIEVARLARRFPAVLERLANGSVTLTSLRLIAPHLTAGNVEALLEKKKLAVTARPRQTPSPGGRSRHIPASVRRQVWKRDDGRCAYEGSQGRCPETGFLEFHHVQPYAAGGGASVENLELRCKAHNAHEAELFFGARMPTLVREQRAEWPVETGPGTSVADCFRTTQGFLGTTTQSSRFAVQERNQREIVGGIVRAFPQEFGFVRERTADRCKAAFQQRRESLVFGSLCFRRKGVERNQRTVDGEDVVDEGRAIQLNARQFTDALHEAFGGALAAVAANFLCRSIGGARGLGRC